MDCAALLCKNNNNAYVQGKAATYSKNQKIKTVSKKERKKEPSYITSNIIVLAACCFDFLTWNPIRTLSYTQWMMLLLQQQHNSIIYIARIIIKLAATVRVTIDHHNPGKRARKKERKFLLIYKVILCFLPSCVPVIFLLALILLCFDWMIHRCHKFATITI